MVATLTVPEVQVSLEARVYSTLVARSLSRASLDKPQDQARIVAWDELVYRFLCEEEYTEFPRGVLDLFADAPLYGLLQDIRSELDDHPDFLGNARKFAWGIFQQLRSEFESYLDTDLLPSSPSSSNLEEWEMLLYETTLYLFPDLIYEPLQPSDIADYEVAPFLDFLALGCTRLFLTTSRILLGLPTGEPELSHVIQARISIPHAVAIAEGLNRFRLLSHYLSGCLDGVQNYSMSSSLHDYYGYLFSSSALDLYQQGWELVVFAQPAPTTKRGRSKPPVAGKPGTRTDRQRESPSPKKRILRLPIQPPTPEELAPPKLPRHNVGPFTPPPTDIPDPSRRTVNFTQFDPDTRQRRPKRRSFDPRGRRKYGQRISALISYRELKEMSSFERGSYLRDWVRDSAFADKKIASVFHYLWQWELNFVQTRIAQMPHATVGEVSCPFEELVDYLGMKREDALLFLNTMELKSQVVGIRTLYFHPPGGDPIVYTPQKLAFVTPQYSDYIDVFREEGSLFDSDLIRIEYVKLMRMLLSTSHRLWGFPIPDSIKINP